MVLPDHLPERPHSSPWPAELRGDELVVTCQLEDYALAGVSDVILCDYGVSQDCRLAALEWFAPIMASFQREPAKELR